MQFDNRNRNRLTTLSHRSSGMGFRGLAPNAPILEGSLPFTRPGSLRTFTDAQPQSSFRR